MENIVLKIRDIRKEKGYSHEYMAHLLEISQVAYSKIEKNETKLTVERLYKIAEILEVSVGKLLDIQPTNQFNQINRESSTGYLQHQEIQNLYQENKEIFDKLINSKDEQIELLKSLLDQKR